jgi:diaminohydroxyphosphoribosylaminopyrimidine deaminase/5-amino-6-(5-phosphoribosylamino)uracil reductase
MTDRSAPPDDVAYMWRAIELARRGWGQVAPNPLVGAVIERDGQIVGEGWHRRFGAPHAEIEAIRAAGELAKDATLYVTLEPCAHHGKTGPCAEAVIAAGIRKVVFATPDPNPVAGGGAAVLCRAGVEIVRGIEDDRARALNPAFFQSFDPARAARPWIELKLALSLDGRIADAIGGSSWITGDAARQEVHRLRAGADAVAVGIGTAIIDDPRLTVRGPVQPRIPPVRVVFDRSLRLPPESRLVQSITDAPVWVVCSPDHPAAARSRLEVAGVQVIEASDIAAALRSLRSAGIASVFCEGGARIASALLAADLVDRLTLFYAPILLGADAADPFRELPSFTLGESRRWKHVRTESFGVDTLVSVER